MWRFYNVDVARCSWEATGRNQTVRGEVDRRYRLELVPRQYAVTPTLILDPSSSSPWRQQQQQSQPASATRRNWRQTNLVLNGRLRGRTVRSVCRPCLDRVAQWPVRPTTDNYDDGRRGPVSTAQDAVIAVQTPVGRKLTGPQTHRTLGQRRVTYW